MLKLIFGVELRINLKKDYSHVDFKNSDEDEVISKKIIDFFNEKIKDEINGGYSLFGRDEFFNINENSKVEKFFNGRFNCNYFNLDGSFLMGNRTERLNALEADKIIEIIKNEIIKKIFKFEIPFAFEKNNCEECNGSGYSYTTEECEECGGNGYFEDTCDCCNGQGEIETECMEEHTDGQPCYLCNNEGTYMETCPECNGSGTFRDTCNNCGGSGEVECECECEECGGSGETISVLSTDTTFYNEDEIDYINFVDVFLSRYSIIYREE